MASTAKATPQQQQQKQPRPPKVDPYAHLPPFQPRTPIYYARTEREADRIAACFTAAGGPLGFDIEWRPNYRPGAPENRTALVQLAGRDFVLLAQVAAMDSFPEQLRRVLESPDIAKVGVGIQADAQKLHADWRVAMRQCIDCGALAVTLETARWEAPLPPPRPEKEQEKEKAEGDGATAESGSQQASPPATEDGGGGGERKPRVRLGRDGKPRAPRDPNAPRPVHAPGLARLVGAYLELRLDKPKRIQRSDWEQPLSAEQQEYAANDALAGRAAYIALKKLGSTLARPETPDPRAPHFIAFDCHGAFVSFLSTDAYEVDPALDIMLAAPVSLPPPPAPEEVPPIFEESATGLDAFGYVRPPPGLGATANHWPGLSASAPLTATGRGRGGGGAASGLGSGWPRPAPTQPTRGAPPGSGWGPRGRGGPPASAPIRGQHGAAPPSGRGGGHSQRGGSSSNAPHGHPAGANGNASNAYRGGSNPGSRGRRPAEHEDRDGAGAERARGRGRGRGRGQRGHGRGSANANANSAPS